jgi:S1-C subfamily serine protease
LRDEWSSNLLIVAILACLAHVTPGQDANTITGLIEQASSAIVAILQQGPGGRVSVTSGAVIHQKGFILTTDLPIRGRQGLVLTGQAGLVPYQVVGRLPEKDICLLKMDLEGVPSTLRLGRSNGLVAGQDVLVAGNPGARGVVFVRSTIGNPTIAPSTDFALEVAGLGPDRMDRYIQINARLAALTGGPVLDVEGNLIGIVTSRTTTEDGINLAVPVDRIRAFFYELLAPEERGGFWSGLEVGVLADGALVLYVEPDGPAAKAGLTAGDQILAVYGRQIRDGPDWLLALLGRSPGEAVVVSAARQDKRRECTITLQPYPQGPSYPRQGLSEGIWYAVFKGTFSSLPDLADLEPNSYGIAQTIGLAGLEGTDKEGFAVIFDGMVDIPRSGVYRIILGSDDGSRLFVDGLPVIDNDGIHPYQEAAAVRRLGAGLHHLRLEYFQRSGLAELRLQIEPDNLAGDQSPIPLRLFCD